MNSINIEAAYYIAAIASGIVVIFAAIFIVKKMR